MTFIYSVLHSPNKDIEATTLWMENTTLFQQRHRGNNIVDGTPYPLPTEIQRQQHCGSNTRNFSGSMSSAQAIVMAL